MIRRHERPGHALRSRPQPGSPHRHPRHRAGRRAGRVLRADAGGAGRRRHQGGAARRQSDAPDRALLPGPRGSRALPVLLAVQPREALDRARPAPAERPRSVPRAGRHRRRAAGVDTAGRARRVRARRERADAAVARPDRRARVPVRRRGPVGRLQGLGPRAPGARRRDDELRLRSRARRHVRPAAHRSADVARLPHRRRAARVLHRRRAALSLADGEGPARVVRDPRGGGEVHRGRSHDVGDASSARAAPDLPSRA